MELTTPNSFPLIDSVKSLVDKFETREAFFTEYSGINTPSFLEVELVLNSEKEEESHDLVYSYGSTTDNVEATKELWGTALRGLGFEFPSEEEKEDE